MNALTICVDACGTFVDLALFEGSSLLRTHKILNTPARDPPAGCPAIIPMDDLSSQDHL